MTDEDFSFTDFLADFGHGATNQQLRERMQSLVRACTEHSGKGKLVLTFDVKGADGRAEIKASVKTTEPQPGSASATYFATETGALVTQDPKQTSIPARILEPTPIRGGKA